MAKAKNYSTTIAIDSDRCLIHFYSMAGNDKSSISHFVKPYAQGPMNEQFFERFKESVQKFAERMPSQAVRKITVILPESAVATDTVRVPTMKGMDKTQQALEDTLGGLYRNHEDLYVASDVMDQNKQFTTFTIAAVKKDIISNIYSICAENRLLVDTLAYTSSATVCGAIQLNPKLRNANYLFLDIKGTFSRFVFVVNGNTMGSYKLPFGMDFLSEEEVIPEEMLFDHSYAELSLWYAKARVKSVKAETAAQAKAEDTDEFETVRDTEELPAVSDEAAPSDEEIDLDFDLDDDEDYDEEDEEIQDAVQEDDDDMNLPDVEEFMKKTPRRLPKFMIRPIPETEEGVIAENFRVFMKWALALIESNENIVKLGRPEFVCVNLPKELSFVLDKMNEEEAENKLRFIPLHSGDDQPEVYGNLEMFGGMFPKMLCWNGRF
jgi:hypothetical protein